MEAGGELNPDLEGKRIFKPFDKLAPPINPLTHEDLVPLSSESYWEEMRKIESEYDRLAEERFAFSNNVDPFKMVISSLAREDQENLVGRIDELTGAKSLWEKGIGPTMFRHYYDSEGDVERSPAGRMVFAAQEFLRDIDPRILQMSQQTVRFDRSRSAITAENYYSAGTQYRPNVMQHMQELLENGFEDTSKTGLIFDVETPGLNPEEGIWQLSARIRRPGQEAIDKTFTFKNPKMQWGGVIGPEGTSLMPEVAGDYVENMKEFLTMVEESDEIGGHNVLFDYSMLSRGLKRNLAYTTDPEYGRLVDVFHNKFYNSETKKIGRVIDTNVLARNIIPNISLAKELRQGPTPYQFSLQNILLETDLLKQIEEQVGPDVVSGWLNKGLHQADVDVPIETYLKTALSQHHQFLKGTGGRELRMGNYLSNEQRQRVLQSRPIGPNIKLSQRSQIVSSLVDRVEAANLIDKYGNINLTPMDQMVALQRKLTSPISGPELYKAGPSISEQLKNKDIGGIFKRAKRAFWDVDSDETALDLASKTNTWARYSRWRRDQETGWITGAGQVADQGHYPTMEEWSKFQGELEKANIPYAGLSWPERHIASLLGESGGVREEGRIRKIFGSDVASLGHFKEAPNLDVVGQSQIATVPMTYLEQWEKSLGESASTYFTRPEEGAQFLALSPFKHTGRRIDEVGLMFQASEEEKTSLLGFLRSHPDFQENPKLLEDLRQAFTNNSGTYGIQVGTLNALKGGESTSVISNALRQLSGIGADTSDQTPQFLVQFAGRNILHTAPVEGQGSLYTAGAFMKKELLEPEELASLPSNMSTMVRRYKNLNEDIRNERMLSFFSGVKRKGLEGEGISKYWNIEQSLAKRGPVILGAATVAAGGYYIHKRNQQNKITDQTYAAQPEEPDDWYDRNRRNAIPSNPRKRPNYLATANVVSNADANKIAHTNMSPDKYGYLFSTGY